MTVARITVLVLVALTAATVAATSPAAPPKAFPQGCWVGKGAFTGTYSTGNLKAKVTNGKFDFALWVTSAKKALGVVDITSHGNGTLKLAGSELAMEVNMTGDLDVEGPASAPVASGTWRWKGAAIGTGQFAGAGSIPVDIKLPLKGQLTILTVSKLKLTGLFRGLKWTAVKYTSKETKATCL